MSEIVLHYSGNSLAPAASAIRGNTYFELVNHPNGAVLGLRPLARGKRR
jgi:hypothetical protein